MKKIALVMLPILIFISVSYAMTARVIVISGSLPQITILSPTNNTSYYKLNVPLNFTIDKPTSWIGYSLDSNPNITIPGPINLSSNAFSSYFISNGHHNIRVFANDTSGNMGSSNKVNFFYCLGDLTGGTPNVLDFVPDGKVDMRDVGLVAKLFGCNAGSACYDARADITGQYGVPDGQIDMRDLAIVAKQFGTTC